MTTKHLAGAALVAALALPSAAQAHVTLQPSSAAAGSYVVESVRVPNERDDAATTKVDLQLPDGFASVSYQATPGWTVKVQTEKLAQPVTTDDGELTEGVRRITWTADSKDDAIQPGQFRDFPISVKVPGKDGDTLTFKALQTYSSGEVVRWIGAVGSDTPAPTVAVTAATGDHGASVAPSTSTEASSSDGASKGLGIAALAVAIVAALLAAAALASRRRTA